MSTNLYRERKPCLIPVYAEIRWKNVLGLTEIFPMTPLPYSYYTDGSPGCLVDQAFICGA